MLDGWTAGWCHLPFGAVSRENPPGIFTQRTPPPQSLNCQWPCRAPHLGLTIRLTSRVLLKIQIPAALGVRSPWSGMRPRSIYFYHALTMVGWRMGMGASAPVEDSPGPPAPTAQLDRKLRSSLRNGLFPTNSKEKDEGP